jgi:zinc-binding alcohol dehydrogenase family protein
MMSVMIKAGSKADEDGAFYLSQQDIPVPGPMDFLVRIEAIGMNPVDTKIRQRAEADRAAGWDACGIVEKKGSEVEGFQKGDRVFYAGDLTRPGCNSEYQNVDSRIAARAPESLSPEESAAMPLTSITAWEGIFERLGFTAEEGANRGRSILIIGAAGGVGSAALQLARWAGLKVYATASRPETAEWCASLGADIILNHRNDLYEELKGQGAESVDAIFCTTQMERHWKAMSQSIRPQGRIVLIDDPSEPVDITLLKAKSVGLFWEFMYTRSMFHTDDMDEHVKPLKRVAELLDKGILRSTKTLRLEGLSPENIRDMHIRQEKGRMIGKQVLAL